MFTQAKIKTNPLFRENLLIFDAEGKLNLVNAFNPEPLLRTNTFVNPETNVGEFIANEKKAAGAAMQKPVKETCKGVKDAIGRTCKDVLSVPQEMVDTVTGAVGNTVSWATRLAGSTIRLPIATAGYVASFPFALAGNIGRHVFDILRLPFSVANVLIAKTSHVPLKVSATANEYRGKTVARSDKYDQGFQTVGENLRKRITSLRLPLIGNMKPSARGAKTESSDAAQAADAGGGGGD